MYRSGFAFTFLVATIASRAPAAEPATRPDAVEVDAAPDPVAAVGETMSVPDLSAVFRLSVKGGFLSLDTDLPPTGLPVRVRTPGLPAGGDAKVDPSPAGAGDAGGPGRPAGALRAFRFTTPPDAVAEPIAKTTVMAIANALHVSQDAELGQGIRSVQYVQQVPLVDGLAIGDEPPVKLYVNISDAVSGLSTVRLQLGAASFEALRQQHPREVAIYLAPLLAHVQQDAAVFAPSPAVARQALRAEQPVDPAMAKRVDGLIAALASPDPAARDAAAIALDALGEPGALAAAGVDRAALSAEQNSLIDALLAARLPADPDRIAQLASDPSFLVDCLYLDDADLRARAFARLKAGTSLPLTFDADAPADARRAQVQRLRAAVMTWAATQPSAGG